MDYSRQASLVKPNLPRVSIIGCGGIGSWIALFCTLAGVSIIDLWDGDTVETSNLARTPYRPHDVGKRKSAALAMILREYRDSPDIGAFSYWNGQSFEPHDHGVYVVGAVDGTKTRREIAEVAAKTGAYYIDVGAEANGWNISDAPADWNVVAPVEQRGYFTPIFVSPVAMVAACVSWVILGQDVRQPIHLRFDKLTGGFFRLAEVPEI